MAKRPSLPNWNPKTIWILVDTSNSNERSKNYLWWFETRKIARDFLKHHNRVYNRNKRSTLIGPFKYVGIFRCSSTFGNKRCQRQFPHPKVEHQYKARSGKRNRYMMTW